MTHYLPPRSNSLQRLQSFTNYSNQQARGHQCGIHITLERQRREREMRKRIASRYSIQKPTQQPYRFYHTRSNYHIPIIKNYQPLYQEPEKPFLLKALESLLDWLDGY